MKNELYYQKWQFVFSESHMHKNIEWTRIKDMRLCLHCWAMSSTLALDDSVCSSTIDASVSS